MEDRIREIVSQKLGAHECAAPTECWDKVSSRLTGQASGWAAQAKWLIAAGVTIAAASIASVVLIQDKAVDTTLSAEPAAQRMEQPVPAEGASPAGEEQIAPMNEIEEVVSTHSAPLDVESGSSETNQAADAALDAPAQPIRQDVFQPNPNDVRAEQPAISIPGRADSAEAQSVELAVSVVNAAEMRYFFIPSETEAVEYRWSFGDGNTSAEMSPEHTYEEPGTYEVILEVKTGSGQKQVHKLLECYPSAKLVVPTIFTPNGDGKNDYFDPSELSSYVRVTSIQISDATGKLIYKNMGNIPWDGLTTGGTEAPEGNYLFEIIGVDLRQQMVEKRGFVFLQR